MNFFNDEGPSGTGLELAEGELLAHLFANLSAQIDRQQETWDFYDKQLSMRLQQPYRRTIIEKPPKQSYYMGSRLGVLGMPWDTFPAIAVMADSASPTPESLQFDQSTDVFAPQIYVEAVVRSDPYRRVEPDASSKQNRDALVDRVFQEGVCNRRAKRLMEAVVACVSIDPTIGGVFQPFPAPSVAHTDPFNLDGEDPGGQHLSRVFAIIRVQYSLDFYSARLDGGQPLPGILPMDVPAR